MEIRRKKKKSAVDKLFSAAIALGVCAIVVFLASFLHALASLGIRGPTPLLSTTSKLAEDAQYQLNRREVYRKSHDEFLAGRGANDKRLSSDSDFRDPGSTDTDLTPLEKIRVEKMRLPRPIETMDGDLPYDIHRCPSIIPDYYPYAWSILDVLKNWNPDDTRIPDRIYQGLCAIDWSDPLQRKIAVHYRENEVPFIVKNHPVTWRTADRWSDYDYLHSKLGGKTYRNEHSENNHMMFWKLRGVGKRPSGWKPPTEDVEISFSEWYQKAKSLEVNPDSSSTTEHFYFRLNAGKSDGTGKNPWMFEELAFFNPKVQNDIFMVEPAFARGINCRFGSRGIIAELHYDESRNFILILQGQKRYVLGHPDQCINMELYSGGHPSARHSRINWSDANSWLHGGKNFRNAMVNEVVLDTGDGLYLPTYWFHFIVSLSLNYQCNARSGVTYEYQDFIHECGFQ